MDKLSIHKKTATCKDEDKLSVHRREIETETGTSSQFNEKKLKNRVREKQAADTWTKKRRQKQGHVA
jgi:hypothetical protein